MTSPESARSAADPKTLIVETVESRAKHETLDQVTSTHSDWHVEQTLKREYYGRFLLELIQNARDAWNGMHDGSEDGVLAIRIGSDRSLTVANEGLFLPAERVIHSISKVGQSTKPEGTSIGHKGIGFKSVLEISLTPEIYSRRVPDGPFDLRVKYDPDQAVALVRKHSNGWNELVQRAAVEAEVPARPEQVPLLMFPVWSDEEPAWLAQASRLDDRAFNTVVRLSHDPRFDRRLGLDGGEWDQRVRKAVDELSDTIVLLLRSFKRIVIDDELRQTRRVIAREVLDVQQWDDGTTVSEVVISRDRAVSSEWLLYRRQLDRDADALSSELCIAVRLERDETGRRVPAMPGGPVPTAPGNCFHLFFPTEIPTRLPLLVHAYFQVDASRKGFAADANARNRALLDALVELGSGAVSHLGASAPPWDVVPHALPDLFGVAAGEHDDELARAFREALVTKLDGVDWVIARGPDDDEVVVSPTAVLADPRADLAVRLADAFEPGYLVQRVGGYLPSAQIGRSGLEFLDKRRHAGQPDGQGLPVALYRELLEPRGADPWRPEADRMDEGFRAVLALIDALHGQDPAEGDALIDSVRGNEAAAIVPVMAPTSSGRHLRHFPPKPEPGREIEGGAILARAGTGSGPQPTPPRSLRVDFVAEGLGAELLNGIGGRLGISEYTNDTVLNAIAAAPDSADPAEVLQFVWQLLRHEAQSTYGLAAVARTLGSFHPGQWFWARHGDTRTDAERRRNEGLARVRVRTADGGWAPAGAVAFGTAWAEWLDRLPVALNLGQRERVAAYQELEELAPGRRSLAAAPGVFADLLPADAATDAEEWLGVDPGLVAEADLHGAMLLALLLRLGVWEVPPIDAFVDDRDRPSDRRVPWTDLADRDAHMFGIAAESSEFNDYGHENVHVAEDYRLLWPIEGASTLANALARGVDLCRACRHPRLFCSGCKSHRTRYRYSPALAPSYLLYQLQTHPWVPVERERIRTQPVRADEAWWELEVPDSTRIRQSPLRYLNLVPEDFDEGLAALVGVQSLERADAGRLERLLVELRDLHDELGEPMSVGTEAGRAFMGLHRQVYERMHHRAKDEEAREHLRSVVQETRVLATMGSHLGFVPPADARHDNGEASVWKPLFGSRIPFVVVKSDQAPVAGTLGVAPFSVEVSPDIGDDGVDVTDEVRGLIHERAAEFLALMCYYAIGGPTLDPGSRQFHQRATRLGALTVKQVGDLVLHLHVTGTEERQTVGHGGGADVYLDNARSAAPVLIHDFTDEAWPEHLRRVMGAPLSQLLENDAYRGEFQLLLLEETDAGRSAFLRERGIDDERLEEVRVLIGQADRQARLAAARWWSVLLPILGATVPADPGDPLEVHTALEKASLFDGLGSLGEQLVRAGAGTEVRGDAAPDGVLIALERHGVDLRKFDTALREAGDEGLRVGVAQRRLIEWRRRHRREVVAVLVKRNWDERAALSAPDAWRSSPDVEFIADPSPVTWLAPVQRDLHSVTRDVRVELLGDPAQASHHLADLVGMSVDELSELATAFGNPGERAEYERQLAREWRRSLVPILVAARTRPGDEKFRVRDEREALEELLASSEPSVDGLAAALPALLPREPALASGLATWIQEYNRLSAATEDEMIDALASHFADLDHVRRVREILQQRSRQQVDALRKSVAELIDSGVEPQPFAGSRPPVRREKARGERIAVDRPPRKHDPEHLDRLGRTGESWAVAAVVRYLLELEPDIRRAAVHSMADALAAVFRNPKVDALVTKAAEAVAPDADEDDALAALESFVHVSRVSDQFGFDVLGFLPLYTDAEPEVAFFEVKSSKDRTFKVTATEWSRANDPRTRDRYAFMVILRGKGGTPEQMEIVPDPATRHERHELELREETWEVSYRPLET